jgi:hypothetical protein
MIKMNEKIKIQDRNDYHSKRKIILSHEDSLLLMYNISSTHCLILWDVHSDILRHSYNASHYGANSLRTVPKTITIFTS